MKTTRDFEEQVWRKRPYIQRDWCLTALGDPLKREIQLDGRVRVWSKVEAMSGNKPRYLRVVTLEDGETIHNAFLDRDFREDDQ